MKHKHNYASSNANTKEVFGTLFDLNKNVGSGDGAPNL